jgi:hypothetical protein
MSATPATSALFPQLLRDGFARLDPRVQALHGGASGQWRGVASVRWGSTWVAHCLNRLAGMPRPVEHAPVEVRIEALGDRECWTRRFGGGPLLRSVLSRGDGELVERMGVVTLRFHLRVGAGGIDWQLRRVGVCGITMPATLFAVVARSGWDTQGYRFTVATRVRGVGPLVAYEGGLDVAGD